MEEKNVKDLIFLFFMLTVLILAVLYFSVPERAVFLENQMKWWGELWDILIK